MISLEDAREQFDEQKYIYLGDMLSKIYGECLIDFENNKFWLNISRSYISKVIPLSSLYFKTINDYIREGKLEVLNSGDSSEGYLEYNAYYSNEYLEKDTFKEIIEMNISLREKYKEKFIILEDVLDTFNELECNCFYRSLGLYHMPWYIGNYLEGSYLLEWEKECAENKDKYSFEERVDKVSVLIDIGMKEFLLDVRETLEKEIAKRIKLLEELDKAEIDLGLLE